ncbi:MAG: peptidoglycan DD-metalloendopeptidase family protein, partial [Oscillochloris sp.]|nr:peptidoglycan DD-metalloendopeptidase family protein [Oscillochloris sp.]
TPILAAADGLAYPRTHRGNGVLIVHPGGYETVYWHLSAFAPLLRDRVDSDVGIPVRVGDLIGYSGASGFVRGTPHLHFEVRRYGKQVDPYGWYGPGVDPCAIYAGCLASTWLWSDALRGTYDFTPPGATSTVGGPLASDTNPPVGTLSVSSPDDLLFRARFDGHPVQAVGAGFPEIAGELRYIQGRDGQALATGSAGLAYASGDNLRPAEGSISIWVELPEHYPSNNLLRHYLLAASANASGAPDYIGTLALRRDLLGPNEHPRWTFWTVGPDAATSHELAVPDNLAPGWHHMTITWDAAMGSKALYLDGDVVAQASGVTLAADLGSVLQIGRFTYGGSAAGVAIDDLAIYRRALTAGEVRVLAAAAPEGASTTVTAQRQVRLDTNAIDREGGIIAVQLGVDGTFADPQPYYDSYTWLLPADEGWHTVAARYTDRAGNSTIVSSTVLLNLAPQLSHVKVRQTRPLGATLEIRARDTLGPLMMQISQRPDFGSATWQPLRQSLFWAWNPALPPQIYVRVRDQVGNLSSVLVAVPPGQMVYLPMVPG